jgi:hypothetical protein
VDASSFVLDRPTALAQTRSQPPPGGRPVAPGVSRAISRTPPPSRSASQGRAPQRKCRACARYHGGHRHDDLAIAAAGVVALAAEATVIIGSARSRRNKSAPRSTTIRASRTTGRRRGRRWHARPGFCSAGTGKGRGLGCWAPWLADGRTDRCTWAGTRWGLPPSEAVCAPSFTPCRCRTPVHLSRLAQGVPMRRDGRSLLCRLRVTPGRTRDAASAVAMHLTGVIAELGPMHRTVEEPPLPGCSGDNRNAARRHLGRRRAGRRSWPPH